MTAKRNHPLYRRWRNMISRCYKHYNNNYKYYGGKGTIVCERWHTFENFVEDIDNHMLNGHLMYQKGYDLDKDIKGANIYSLENCVVVTAIENRELARAKQKKKIIATKGNEHMEFSSVSLASKELGINRGSIQQYLKKGDVHTSGYSFKYA